MDTTVFNKPSLVMNEMNSLTHSCMHSLASFAIFALSGNAVFMIRATVAKLAIDASDGVLNLLGRRGVEGEDDELDESADITEGQAR